jgi:uncharacterized OB-fold protein
MSNHALPGGLPRPVPSPDGLDAPYWAGTRAHELRVQRCADCGTFRWGPEWLCFAWLSRSIVWPIVDPHGVLFSWERVWHPVHPALADAVPYVVALVEVPGADGVRMVGNLLGVDGRPMAPDVPIPIGAPVDAVFEDHDDTSDGALPFTLVQWKLRA